MATWIPKKWPLMAAVLVLFFQALYLINLRVTELPKRVRRQAETTAPEVPATTVPAAATNVPDTTAAVPVPVTVPPIEGPIATETATGSESEVTDIPPSEITPIGDTILPTVSISTLETVNDTEVNVTRATEATVSTEAASTEATIDESGGKWLICYKGGRKKGLCWSPNPEALTTAPPS